MSLILVFFISSSRGFVLGPGMRVNVRYSFRRAVSGSELTGIVAEAKGC